MKIKDVESGNNPYNLKIADSVWQWKQYGLSKIGGIVLPMPMPNPRSFSVFGLEALGLEPGDFIMVARDNSNNPKYNIKPMFEVVQGVRVQIPQIMNLEEIKDGCVGQVKYIEISNNIKGGVAWTSGEGENEQEHLVNARGGRITLVADLTVEGTSGVKGWPKVNGAVCKILTKDNTLINETLSGRIEKAKKIHGSQWASKVKGGDYDWDE